MSTPQSRPAPLDKDGLLAYDVQPDRSVTNRRNFTKYAQIIASAAGDDVGPGLRYKVTSCADGMAIDKKVPDGRRYRTAIGATVEPVAPTSFSGSTMSANSYTRWAASSSSLRFSSRKIPFTTSAI